MAISQHNITAITDIPPLVAAFATANGFEVSGTSTTPVISREDGVAFKLTATISGYNHDLVWTRDTDTSITSNAFIRSPKLRGTSSVPVVSIPSKVYIIGGQEPQPFIHIVVEYAFNSYRHLYFGHMEKLGDYTGGEVISGAMPYNGTSDSNTSYYSTQFLFNAYQSIISVASAGGVNIVHADNPTPWRRFQRTGSDPYNDFDGTEAFGGFGDDVNDGYLARGFSSYASGNLLVPINLYAPLGSGSTVTHVPIGRPAGIRMVNMQNLEPGQEMTIGSDTWRVFPAVTKSESQTVSRYPGGWTNGETSYLIGYALLTSAD